MILVGGENLIDFIQVSSEGGAPHYRANVGGSPFNTTKALARQGMSVGYMTSISSDTMGDLLADDLIKEGVELLAPRRAEPTSLAVVSLKSGTPSYQFYRENTADRIVTLEGLLGQLPDGLASAFQLGSLAITGGDDAEAWVDFYIQMKAAGVFTSLDPNIRPAFIHDRKVYLARLARLLEKTDLIKLSDEDLEWIFPDEPLFAAAEKLSRQTSAKLVVVTLGPDGAFAIFKGNTTIIKPAPVNGLVDTVGAGDTFMAALIASLFQSGRLSCTALEAMSESDVEFLLKRASCAAALNCEQAGCNPPDLRTLDKIYPVKMGKA
ncbi:MAG: carbohydrate kinase [Paracoccaceae bacterium]